MYLGKFLLSLPMFLVLFAWVIGQDPVSLRMSFYDEFGEDVSLVMEGGTAVVECETDAACTGNVDMQFFKSQVPVGTASCTNRRGKIRFNITDEFQGAYECRYGNESSKPTNITYRICADDGIHCKSPRTCKDEMCVWYNGKYETCSTIPDNACNMHSGQYVYCTKTGLSNSLCHASSVYSTVLVEQSGKSCDTALPRMAYSTELKFRQAILLDKSKDRIEFSCPSRTRTENASMNWVLKNSKGEIVYNQTVICHRIADYVFDKGLPTNGTQVFQLTTTFNKSSDITRVVYRLVVINAKVTINQTMNKKNSTYTDKLQCNVPLPRWFNATYTWFGNNTGRLDETANELFIKFDGTYRCEAEIKYVTCYMGTDDIKRTFQSGNVTVKTTPPVLYDATTIKSGQKSIDGNESSDGLQSKPSKNPKNETEAAKPEGKTDWTWLWGLLGGGISFTLLGGGLGYLYNERKQTKAADRELKNQRQNVFEKQSKRKGKGEATATDPAAECRQLAKVDVGKHDNQLLHEKNSGDMDIDTFERYAIKLLNDDNFLDAQHYVHMQEVFKMATEVHTSHHTVKMPGVRHALRVFRPILPVHNATIGEMFFLHANMFQNYEGYHTTLCQASMIGQFDDYIHSLVQYRMGTIVLVGDMVEDDENKKLPGGSTKPSERKIDEYFSLTEGGTKDTENYTVKTVAVINEEASNGCIIYRLRISDRDKSGTKKDTELKPYFTANAIHINNWRDHSAPKDCKLVAKAILRIDSTLDDQAGKHCLYNMMIHCSAGMQRSASVLCMLFCLQRYKVDGKINMLQVMKYLARNRFGALGKYLTKDKIKQQMKVIAMTLPLVIRDYNKLYGQ